MKNWILFFVIAIFVCPALRASDSAKAGYFSVGYGSATFCQKDNPRIKSDLNFNLRLGHTYHLHNSPLSNILWFDIDATWVNCGYSRYNVEHIGWRDPFRDEYHFPYIGMQVGPAVSVVPFSRSLIHAYVRYSPSLVAMIDRENGSKPEISYGSLFDFGFEFSYRAVGIGIGYTIGFSNLPKLEFMNDASFGKSEQSVFKSLTVNLLLKF